MSTRYGPIRALHGVSLTVDESEVVALLEANGAGKTTTLRSISSMTRTSGEITLRPGVASRRSAEVRRPARHRTSRKAAGSFPRLTVWENLRMGAVGPGRRVKLAEEAKRIVGYFP